MSSYTETKVLGRLGQDPELRYTANGKAVCNFSMATNKHWTDKDGKTQEKVEWHKIVVWGKLAENCSQYLKKGSQAFIVGENETREWDDGGVKRTTTEIISNKVCFLGNSAIASQEQTPATPAEA